jgi:hypothetical protein
MTQEQLDNMFNHLYPQLGAARSAMELSDAIDNLIVAVWKYQSAHNAPRCDNLERALAVASHVQEQYTDGPQDEVEKLFHLRGLDMLRYHEMRVQHAYERQEAARKAKEAKPKKAKPKKAKAPKVKLAKAA